MCLVIKRTLKKRVLDVHLLDGELVVSGGHKEETCSTMWTPQVPRFGRLNRCEGRAFSRLLSRSSDFHVRLEVAGVQVHIAEVNFAPRSRLSHELLRVALGFGPFPEPGAIHPCVCSEVHAVDHCRIVGRETILGTSALQ